MTALGADLPSQFGELVDHQAIQQLRIGHIARVLRVAEQVASHVPACGFVPLKRDERHQGAAACVDLALCDGFTQALWLAGPGIGSVKPQAFLHAVVVRERERDGLLVGHAIFAEHFQQSGRDAGELQLPLHGTLGQREQRRDIGNRAAFFLEFLICQAQVCRVHRLVLLVLDQRRRHRLTFADDFDGHQIACIDAPCCQQQLQGQQTALARAYAKRDTAIVRGGYFVNDEALQDALRGDVLRQGFNAARLLASHVVRRDHESANSDHLNRGNSYRRERPTNGLRGFNHRMTPVSDLGNMPGLMASIGHCALFTYTDYLH